MRSPFIGAPFWINVGLLLWVKTETTGKVWTSKPIASRRVCTGDNVTFTWQLEKDFRQNVKTIHISKEARKEITTFVLKRDSKIVQDNPRATLLGKEGIILHNVQPSDSGEYENTIQLNNGSHIESKVRLEVTDNFMEWNDMPPDRIDVCAGDDIQLPWSFNSHSRNAIKIRILKQHEKEQVVILLKTTESEQLFPRASRYNNAGIRLRNVNVSDSGMYTCIVNFKDGCTITGHTNIFVQRVGQSHCPSPLRSTDECMFCEDVATKTYQHVHILIEGLLVVTLIGSILAVVIYKRRVFKKCGNNKYETVTMETNREQQSISASQL